MQGAVCPYGTVHHPAAGDRQPFLPGQKELRYHPEGADEIDETQPIDDLLSLPYREPLTPMAEPKVHSQIVAGE